MALAAVAHGCWRAGGGEITFTGQTTASLCIEVEVQVDGVERLPEPVRLVLTPLNHHMFRFVNPDAPKDRYEMDIAPEAFSGHTTAVGARRLLATQKASVPMEAAVLEHQQEGPWASWREREARGFSPWRAGGYMVEVQAPSGFRAEPSRLRVKGTESHVKVRLVREGADLEVPSSASLRFPAETTPGPYDRALGPVPVRHLTPTAHDGRGWRVAAVYPDGKSDVLWIDGKVGDKRGHIDPRSVSFSWDGSRLAYAASDARSDRPPEWHMVSDGSRGRGYDQIAAGSAVLSRDGQHLAYAARSHHKWYVVMDGRVRPSWREPLEIGPGQGRLSMSPDGGHLAYVVEREGKQAVVLDGRVGGLYDRLDSRHLVFSPDSRHLAYLAADATGAFVVRDGQRGPRYDSFVPGTLAFSRDGRHLAYAMRKCPKVAIVVDGRPTAECDVLMEDGLVLSRMGLRIAYAAQSGGQWFVTVDGSRGPRYEGIGKGSLVFSEDGRRFGYAAMKGGKWTAIIDGKASPECSAIAQIAFSPDGKRWAYSARRGGNWAVVCNGQTVADGFRGVGDLRFSPDGGHLAFAARGRDGSYVVVLDGRAVGEYDDLVPGGPTFHDDGRLEWLGVRDKVLYRAVAPTAGVNGR